MDRPTRRLDAEEVPARCPKCGNVRVWAGVDGGRGAIRVSQLVGKGLLGLDKGATFCVALVCTGCGFTEFYAQEPQKLLE